MNKDKQKLYGVLGLVLVILIVLVTQVSKSNDKGAFQETAQNNPVSASKIAIESISVNSDTASVAGSLETERTIKWKTADYPSGAGVSINLLRKVSESPISYELVYIIAENTNNDGSESWILEENTGDLYVEVVCGSYNFKDGCSTTAEPIKVI